MTQGELGHRFYIFLGDGTRAAPGSMGARATQPDQVGAQAIDTSGKAPLGDLRQGLVVQFNTVEPLARLGATLSLIHI